MPVYRIVIYCFILSCFFPYISLFNLKTDAQPTAFLISFLVVFTFQNNRIDKTILLLFLVFAYSLVILFFNPITFVSLRSLFGYTSLMMVTYASYKSLIKINGLPYTLFVYTILIWFIVGFVQTFVKSDFLAFLVPRSINGTLVGGRGVCGISPEPSHYGMMCLFFLIMAYLNFNGRKKINLIYLLILIQLFIFSRSSVSIFVLIISVLVYCMYRVFKDGKFINLFYFLVFGLFVYIVMPFLLNIISHYRVGILLAKLINSPVNFLVSDGSVQERFCHLFFSFYGTIMNYGLPHGYDNFFFINQNQFEFAYGLRNQYERIASAIGGAFYELGMIAFIPIYAFLKYFKILARVNGNLLFLILFVVILLVGFTFSSPNITFILGNIMYLGYKLSNKF